MEKTQIDILWVLICSGLVFFMQAGFLCLEAGLTRNKNSINTAMKNMADFSLSVIFFWLIGFAFMYGQTHNGWIGQSHYLVTMNNPDPWILVFFLFQAMFCGTGMTIVSGIVAERMRFVSYLMVTVLFACFIYPIFGHWAWGSIVSAKSGWLAKLGFIDFAGGTVVHSTGGWVGLAIVIILGARVGRFPKDQLPKKITASNMPIAMLGALLLWIGWIGFNGGSTMAFNDSVVKIVVNTILSGCGGLIGAMSMGRVIRGYFEPRHLINGGLAGLVAITANCHVVHMIDAIVIGVIGAVVMIGVEYLLEQYHVDDAVGGIAVHLGAGVWGTLAVAIFGDPIILNTGLSWWSQLGVQGLGVVVNAVYAFGLTFILITIINRIYPMRVKVEEELKGLNISEHEATTELIDLLQFMEMQAKTENISRDAPVEPFTEVGQIAQRYNYLLRRLRALMVRTGQLVQTAGDGILTFLDDSLTITSINQSGLKLFGYNQESLIGQSIASVMKMDPISLENNLKTDDDKVLAKTIGKRQDGEEILIEVNITKTEISDEKIYTAIVRDISEKERYQKEMQKNNEQLIKTVKSLETTNQFLVDRELRMIGLKKEINTLLHRLGEAKRYN